MFSNLFSGEQKTGWKKTWGSRAKWGTVMGHNNSSDWYRTDTRSGESKHWRVGHNVVWTENRDHKDKLRACAGYYCAESDGSWRAFVHSSPLLIVRFCRKLSRRTWTACSWIISASQLVHQYIILIKDRTFQGFRTKTRYDVGYGLIESWSALPVCIVQKYFIDVSNSSRHKDQLARQIQ